MLPLNCLLAGEGKSGVEYEFGFDVLRQGFSPEAANIMLLTIVGRYTCSN